MVGAALLSLAARLSAGDAPQLVDIASVIGLACLLGGLILRRGALVTTALAFVGAAYAVSLIGRQLDPAASLYAGGLLLVAELAFWALEPGAAVRVGRRATARRAAFSVGLALVAVLVGALLLGVASAPAGRSATIGIAGVAAVAAIIALVIGLMHTLRPRGRVR